MSIEKSIKQVTIQHTMFVSGHPRQNKKWLVSGVMMASGSSHEDWVFAPGTCSDGKASWGLAELEEVSLWHKGPVTAMRDAAGHPCDEWICTRPFGARIPKYIDESYPTRSLVVVDDEGQLVFAESARGYGTGWDADSLRDYQEASNGEELFDESDECGVDPYGTRYRLTDEGRMYWQVSAAARVAAPRVLRASGRLDEALRLEALPPVTGPATCHGAKLALTALMSDPTNMEGDEIVLRAAWSAASRALSLECEIVARCAREADAVAAREHNR